MGIVFREPQANALVALDKHWLDGGTSSLISIATGVGKSLIAAEIARRGVRDGGRVLLGTHVRELIEQDVRALLSLWADAPYGVCSAGLGRRDHDDPIVFGTIQTMNNDIEKMGRFDIMIVDEVHLVSRDEGSMYLKLLASLRSQNPALRLVGLSATCYRLDSGYLDRGDNAIFEKTVYEYGIAEGIRDGFLAPITSKATGARIDVSGVGRRGGEFIAGELERACNERNVVEYAVSEIVALGQDRTHWLCFCAGVDHAHDVAENVRQYGIRAATVTADTPSDERRQIFEDFRAGKIRCLTGCNVFNVGFNIEGVDLIAMLRPTLSPGLVVQQVGRGTRPSPGKANCLVLDFAGNIRRHGPIDTITATERPVKPGDVLTKVCPECKEENALAAHKCTCCGHVFVTEARAPKHAPVADVVPALSSGEATWLPVTKASFRVHHKQGDPLATPTLRVNYLCGIESIPEFISFEGSYYAQNFARAWWHSHGGRLPVPRTVTEAIERRAELDCVAALTVYRGGQWWRIRQRRVRRPSGSVAVVNDRYHVIREEAA